MLKLSAPLAAGDVKPIEEQHGDVPHVPAASNVPLSNPEATSTAQELKHKAGSAFGKSPEEPHATDDAHSLHKPEPQVCWPPLLLGLKLQSTP